jgi:phage-related protein
VSAHQPPTSVGDRPSKPLVFVGSTERDLREFPLEAKRVAGYALRVAQQGGKHPDAKPLKGYKGAGVLEIVEDYHTDTYRAVYTVEFPSVVFALHAFQKKSKTGRATPKADLDLIRRRYAEARALHASPPAALAAAMAAYEAAVTAYDTGRAPDGSKRAAPDRRRR